GIGERAVARGRMEAEEAEAIVARISPALDDEALAGVDIAIEAVPEVLDLKRDVFRRLDRVLKPEALLASNTSGLSITALARETGRPDRVLGLHFFNPASVMRLVEAIRGEDTSDATIGAGEDFARSLGKTPVRVVECPGFLVNRLLTRGMLAAYRMAEALGADPAAVDVVVEESGPAPMGPFALGDLVGLDTLDHIQRDLAAAYGPRFAPSRRLSELVAKGRLGRKSGGGFFDGARPEAEPDDAARAVAERYYLAALHEACLCLEEEVAALPDIDLAMRLGARWSEGPLQWADGLGTTEAAARMAAPPPSGGEPLDVPGALAERAAAGRPFHEDAAA
ncbi:MAG: 3-hydroxybutyryl-CoA dehydrogenase, partial [Miltoncostaeaceae bacterium]|nr:3-hydroxybutyryl-CoA dehydrogenase [Miltoncostaeaceae bacterium]